MASLKYDHNPYIGWIVTSDLKSYLMGILHGRRQADVFPDLRFSLPQTCFTVPSLSLLYFTVVTSLVFCNLAKL